MLAESPEPTALPGPVLQDEMFEPCPGPLSRQRWSKSYERALATPYQEAPTKCDIASPLGRNDCSQRRQGKLGRSGSTSSSPGRCGSPDKSATLLPKDVVRCPEEQTKPERFLDQKTARRIRTKARSSFNSWMARVDQARLMEKQHEEELHYAIKKDEIKTGQLASGKGRKLVRDIQEIHRIFNYFDDDQSGFIEPHEFPPLLARLMKTPKSEMDMTEVWRNWDVVDVDGSGKISFEEFQNWYCNTFGIAGPDFTGFFNTRDTDLISEEDWAVREVAKKLDMDYVAAESLYKEFKALDKDQSGSIEFEEFKVLVTNQLAASLKGTQITKFDGDVPAKVLAKFWQDIDTDGSGSVTFEEFAAWHRQFFNTEFSPMEQYYAQQGVYARFNALKTM